MAKYEFRFMFDWGSGTCVWSANDAARKKFDYAVELSQLPISDELVDYLNKICDKHDEALDWDYPPNGLLWSEEEQNAFIKDARDGYEKLCKELGTGYHVVWEDKFII